MEIRIIVSKQSEEIDLSCCSYDFLSVSDEGFFVDDPIDEPFIGDENVLGGTSSELRASEPDNKNNKLVCRKHRHYTE